MDVLLREANVADAVSSTVGRALIVKHTTTRPNQLEETRRVPGTMTRCHALHSPSQSQEPGAVKGELTISQSSQEPAQRQMSGAVGRDT